MQVGLDYQINSAKAQNAFGNSFTVPKLEDLNKVVPSNLSKNTSKPDAFEKVADTKQEVVNPQPSAEGQKETITAPKQPKTFKEKFAGVWKFFASADQMAGAGIRGVIYGAITGVALLAGSWLFKSLPNAFAKEGPGLWNTIRHPLKNIGKSGKIIAGIGAAIVLGVNLVKGKLDTNQRTAVIDHKMKTGHRNA